MWRVSRIVTLSRRDWRSIGAAWLALRRVDRAIRTTPYAAWRHRLDSPPVQAPWAGCSEAEVFRLAGLVQIAARLHLRRMNCLRRSLALKELLARRGFVADVAIGARPVAGGIEAHAWLTHDGVVLNDRADVEAQYPRLATDQWQGKGL
ncbi:MAG: lasso peptide biosynthesis B2 protein [Rhodospirillales bacterium]|nr:lasso peptide biosynthesis B2 protein [Rhodospirillales bacterium]